MRQAHLHVTFAHHDLSRIGKLHQLVQGLRVDVMQRHMCLAALTHLICGDSRSGQASAALGGLQRLPSPLQCLGWVGQYLLVNMAWK